MRAELGGETSGEVRTCHVSPWSIDASSESLVAVAGETNASAYTTSVSNRAAVSW